MGFYTRFNDPEARREIVRYYGFLRENDALYHANRPHAEVVLLYPRRRVHEGDVAAVDRFKRLGRRLLDHHVLFDVLPDDLATPERLAAYRKVVDGLGGRGRPSSTARTSAGSRPRRRSASRRAGPPRASELTVHFVNYNRHEPAKKRSAGTGIADERPRPVSGIEADLRLPPGTRAIGIEALSPEHPGPRELRFESAAGRVRFTMPEFLVYGVAPSAWIRSPPAMLPDRRSGDRGEGDSMGRTSNTLHGRITAPPPGSRPASAALGRRPRLEPWP